MASSNSTGCTQVPIVYHYKLVDEMELQVKVFAFSRGCNAKVELQLKNCTRTWILHWGCISNENKKWFIPADPPPGTNIYKQMALQTPFVMNGDAYTLVIELRDPKIKMIEFVLKEMRHDKWMKINGGNFQIKIPEIDPNASLPLIPKELIERKAYLLWESKGRPVSSPSQQKQDYDNSVRELQQMLSKGFSIDEIRNSFQTSSNLTMTVNREKMGDNPFRAVNKEKLGSQTPHSFHRRHDVVQWLHREDDKSTIPPPSAQIDMMQTSIGTENLIQQQSYHIGNYEFVVLLKILTGDNHIVIAGNTRGSTVLHWGVSKSSPREWLAPPPEVLPEKSKLLDVACQTYFTDVSTSKGFFQFVDINLKQRKFAGIQFIVWSAGSWIKNNGDNFVVDLSPFNSRGKVEHNNVGITKWLLDEISQREKEAEKSLMHRFSIATELTERCRSAGKLGLIGILVWLSFMACRQLSWNKNYNVKPREISEAQDRFTNLLQRIYVDQPNDREIVRLIMGCVGRGGQGHVGHRIRDEILVLQRNNNCMGGMMEEWHQKLHNNSSPDDVIICEALLNYVKSDFNIDVYWRTLTAKGLTKNILASYDRPIRSEPHFRTDTKEGLIRDLTSYLKILKAVHSGSDLESAIDTCLGLSEENQFVGAIGSGSVGVLPVKLQENLRFIRTHIGDKNIGLLMQKLLESRIELRPFLLKYHGRLKDLIFLDLALDLAVRMTVERGFSDLNFANLPQIMLYISLMLENLCLSTVNNEDLIYIIKDWYRICELYEPSGSQWALQTKAVLDRMRLALGDRSQYYHNTIQPSAQYLGGLLSVERWVIDIFTEELIRGGSAGSVSMIANRLDPILRKVANLGCWQVISPAEVCGIVVAVNELITVQNKVYKKPTIIIANKVSGEEEIPDGAVAVLTSDMPDVLAHVSIRARNSKVLFASCFDQSIFSNLKLKDGKALSIRLNSTSLFITDASSSNLSLKPSASSSTVQGFSFKRKTFSNKYVVLLKESNSEMVGAKSCNIKFLSGRVPSWIKLPTSVAIPFGVFEKILSEDINKYKGTTPGCERKHAGYGEPYFLDIMKPSGNHLLRLWDDHSDMFQELAKKISSLGELVDRGDLSKLDIIQHTILGMKAPPQLAQELWSKMRSAGIPWPLGGDNTWDRAWHAMKKVWASKWNERAYISCRKANMNHNNLCMAILVQEIISADYAFVLHTKNPVSGDSSEIYAEIVKGLGETLVGAYPGRAMSFITKKYNLKSPMVIGYPSKSIGLYIKAKRSIIFRSDSNGEDLHGYAGAGLYDSLSMDKQEEVVLDYSNDRMITDIPFQAWMFSRIAEAGKTIEDLYGCAQDIEGVIKDGEVYVVQSRPQI